MKIRKDFTLDPETIAKLEYLSKKYSQSKSAIISRLIAENYENPDQLYEKLKNELKALLDGAKN